MEVAHRSLTSSSPDWVGLGPFAFMGLQSYTHSPHLHKMALFAIAAASIQQRRRAYSCCS